MTDRQDQAVDGIAVIGNTLGPLFYYDPQDDAIEVSYKAFADLDADAAAVEWPFVSDDDAKEALELMVFGAQDFRSEVDDVNNDLIWEYRRLFVGPAAKAAPPWGSVYTDRECVVFGEATLDLRQWMRQTGIEKLNDDKEPEDHIGLMLMMMSWISVNKPEALDDFLRLHLLTWSSHFLEEMEEATDHPFYKGLARITRLSLEGIQEDREIEVEYPRFYR